MQPIIMQDWVTIRGTSNAKVFQSQSGWIDSGPFQDITFFVDVREFTGTTPTLAFETAPGRDEVLFQECVTAFNVTTAPVVKNCYLANATVPVSQWTRWKLTGAAVTPWDVTFRIMAAGNAVAS